jgi:hypothetical protein
MSAKNAALESSTQVVRGANFALASDTTGKIWNWDVCAQNQVERLALGRHMDSLGPPLVEFLEVTLDILPLACILIHYRR